jgi:hypothetical protein
VRFEPREKPEKPEPRFPWLIPAIAIVAAVIVVAGIVVSIVLGVKLF